MQSLAEWCNIQHHSNIFIISLNSLKAAYLKEVPQRSGTLNLFSIPANIKATGLWESGVLIIAPERKYE